ncbi:hypothetical protein ACHAO8_010050 [Botrytis cinerea]
MANLNTEMSILTATTSEIYFPILTLQCPTLVLQILSARTEAVTTNVTRKQRPRLQLMFPDNYIPSTAIFRDQPCDGLVLQLNPQGGSGRAKCTVRVSKPATSSASIIQYAMKIQFFGTVHDLLNAARDVFGEHNQNFTYRLSNGRLHGGRDFWLQVLIKCYQRQLIYPTNIEGDHYFWYAFEHEWADYEENGGPKHIKKGRFPDEASRQVSVMTHAEGQIDMYYEA